ncbi:beta-aspartyl-peptidase [Marinisporobacter balticus]|uniref:Isoaspartyl dipeptidase n=1 Tax=Marinisporobacter balticus TaxID=2018667 RepID=A0A4V2SBF1_9FIRM|nr:beta-aspartyl-peptidase [Marinisporobacter balticus]TCO75230.1 isoaspartyl dipeptidase [Marinisporobacter balticus]
MLLIKNIEIYAPKFLGKKDVLIGGRKILLVEDKLHLDHKKVQVIDGKGKKMVPGFIDQHVHITGGGGEGSFKTRVPEITLSKLTKAGITTVVGLLGTDSTTRSVENVLAKAKALKEEGISAYIHTGSYEYPTKTLTDSIKKDIVFIDEIIGAKIALSDHRSSNINEDELARLASDVRVAGMMSGKAGILVVHMGNGDKGLKPIMNVVENTEVPIKIIRPTHVNRRENLLIESFDFAKKGGIIDLTCGIYDKLAPGKVILRAKEKNVPIENITMSSDGYGSWSNYDDYGNLIEIGASQVDSLFYEFKKMVDTLDYNIEEALMYLTSNVAKALNLYPKKGCIQERSDADLLILDKNLDIDTVIANGRIMIQKKEIFVKGTYE